MKNATCAICLSFLVLLVGRIGVAQADETLLPGSTIDAEDAGIYGRDLPLDEPCRRFFLRDNERVFPCAEKFASGNADTIRTWLSPSVYFGSPSTGHSIAYETLAAATHITQTQKVMHQIDQEGSEDWIPFNEKRYIGFAFRTAQDEAYAQAPQRSDEAGHGSTIVFQFWQGSPFSPPVAALLEDDGDRDGDGKGDLRMDFVIRNDSSPSCPSDNLLKNFIHIPGFAIKRGHWYKLIIMIIPRHNDTSGDGELKVWMADAGYIADGGSSSNVNWNATPTLLIHWIGKIGYSPELYLYCHEKPGDPKRHRASNHMIASIGLYRNQQPTRMKVFFDQIRVSTTYRAVNQYLQGESEDSNAYKIYLPFTLK
jgi:hypothetical protein